MRPSVPGAEPEARPPGAPLAERPVLVIGFGNTLRRDDGVGVRAAELLSVDPRLGDAVVLARHQLTPELAMDIATASLLILVDADSAAEPGVVSVRGIDPGARRSGVPTTGASGGSTHHVAGGELLALAEELTGYRPPAFSVGIGVADLEIGEGLSAAVEAALADVVDVVVDIVVRHRSV